jgi:transcriptional regulator with XRE-family HTH domain
MASFNRRLRELRGRAGLTQEQVARATGLSTSAVSKLEQHDIDPSWSTVQALAKALGVEVTAFQEVGVGFLAAPPEKPKRTRKPSGKKKGGDR